MHFAGLWYLPNMKFVSQEKKKLWRFSWINMSLNWKWLSRRYTNQINTWLLNLQNQVFICLTKDFLSQFRVQIPNSSAAWVNIPFDVSATYLEVSQPFKCLPSKWSNTLKQFVGCCHQVIWVCMTIFDYFFVLNKKVGKIGKSGDIDLAEWKRSDVTTFKTVKK